MKKVTLFSCWKCKDRVIKDLKKKIKGVEKVESEPGFIVVTGEFDLDDIIKYSDCGSHSSLKSWEIVTPPPKPAPKENSSKAIDKLSFPEHSNNVVVYINNMVVHYHSK